MSAGLDALIDAVRLVEPVLGRATTADVERAQVALAKVDVSTLDEAAKRRAFLALERAAAIAIACGASSASFVDAAAGLAADDDRDELAAARTHPEAFRQLIAARCLILRGLEREGLAAMRAVVKRAPDPALRRAAAAELARPRPVGAAPTLSRFNGIGTTIIERSERGPGGTHRGTTWFTLVFVPVFPIASYWISKVNYRTYRFHARGELTRWERIAQKAIPAAAVAAIATVVLIGALHDPHADAKRRFDRAIAMEHGDNPPAAMSALDAELSSPDLYEVGSRADRAGAALVRLAASTVPSPLTGDDVEQAHKVVLRYQALPQVAQGDEAHGAIVDAVDRWVRELGPADADARMTLLVDGVQVSSERFADRLVQARVARVQELAALDPVAALDVIVDPPRDASLLAQAEPILKEMVTSAPSLLVDAGPALDAWLAATSSSDPLRDQVETARASAIEARDQANDDKATPATLASLRKSRPWDQFAVVRLASEAAAAGKPVDAEKLLTALGPTPRIVRDGRYLLAQVAAADGRLEDADGMLTELVRSRLARFLAARELLETEKKGVDDRLQAAWDGDRIPDDVRAQLEKASSDTAKSDVLGAWAERERQADAGYQAASKTYEAYGDVVGYALAAGSIELRRAQKLDGSARDAMLASAEHLFLSIRAEEEGQADYELGLGEVYARLGKTDESDAELKKVLDRKDPDQSLAVANVYRELGSEARAVEVATQVFQTGDPAHQQAAAVVLSLLASDDDGRATWLAKANPDDGFVRTSLLEIDGRRALRAGKRAECDRDFAKAAQAYLDGGGDASANNAALAQEQRFACTGDLHALSDAEATLERAYRGSPDDAVVVGNLVAVALGDAQLRVLAKHVDVAALRPFGGDVDSLMGTLLAGKERAAVSAELLAEPAIRRVRDLYAQAEVLAPNRVDAYSAEIAIAGAQRDANAVAGVVTRLRAVKNLDTSAAAEARARATSGADDAHAVEASTTQIAEIEATLSGGHLDASTRAAAHFLAGHALAARALLQGDADAMAKARDELNAAQESWPALELHADVVDTLIDEAGLRSDAARWSKERRLSSAVSLLAALVAAGDPLAEQVRASPSWSQVGAAAALEAGVPTLDDWRIARLLGDDALMARARPALTDPFLAAMLDLADLMDPGSPAVAADRALLASP